MEHDRESIIGIAHKLSSNLPEDWGEKTPEERLGHVIDIYNVDAEDADRILWWLPLIGLAGADVRNDISQGDS